MANYTAADVKALREATDAPMMECKAALEEAGGDMEKATDILKQKGKAAASKRADRSTGAGVVAIATSADGSSLGAVVLECETDFVARNEDFVALASDIANAYLAGEFSDPLAVSAGGSTVGELVEGAVAKIRENIKVSQAVHRTSSGRFVTYVHHDRTKGSFVEFTGEFDPEALRKVANQVVAFPPEVLRKEDLSQDRLQRELENQVARAIEEGKPEEMAKQIAQGRVNKEFVREAALMEQMYYADQGKNVATYIKENGNPTIVSFQYLHVGG